MKIHTKILILMFLFIFVLSGCGRQDTEKVSTDKKFDEGFNFILSYGYGKKNVLNTYEGTFTKDLVSAGTIKTKLELSEEEKRAYMMK